MSAPTVTLYNDFAKRLGDATNLLVPSGSFKITLHTNSYAFDAAHSVYADLTNELATAFGYTNGGLALSNVTLTKVTPCLSKISTSLEKSIKARERRSIL